MRGKATERPNQARVMGGIERNHSFISDILSLVNEESGVYLR